MHADGSLVSAFRWGAALSFVMWAIIGLITWSMIP